MIASGSDMEFATPAPESLRFELRTPEVGRKTHRLHLSTFHGAAFMKKRLTKTAHREPGGNLKRVIRSCASILFLLLPLLICSSTLLAQTAFSVLRGTVTDPNGAALPGVKIAVTDLATSISVRTVFTDDH